MPTLLSSVYAISGSNLVLSHTVSDFSQRKTLFGSDVYYFIGTTSDSHSTQTSQFSFTIDFQDACQSATISAQTLTLASPIYRVDLTKQYSLNAFTDSVDSTGSYGTGICGEKTVSLDILNKPAFLTLT